ncbi:MAG: S8 family serine peptidase [Candidatus Muirbacterium halophilum]|nr:S8 family serine peptidase [Candidatus Muirbacterium halophilum]MCK9474357.1 S8 family serine peptidase [Candidatus Muirbacterium halophilum]
MKKSMIAITMVAILSLNSFADSKIPVLVMDSGTDFNHEKLGPVADINLAEFNGIEGVDEDGNGYIDDIYGWNFVENTGTLVHSEYQPPRYDDVLRFMELIGKLTVYGKDSLSADEFNFLLTNYQNKEFNAWVNFTGGWAHGSHVGGIIARNNDVINMKAISHIPVGEPPVAQLIEDAARGLRASLTTRSGEEKAPTMEEIKNYFAYMGMQQAQGVAKERDYVGELAPRVINCSFGTENQQLMASFKQTMVEQWGFANPTEEDVQEMVNLFVELALLPKDKELFSKVPNALIVIAAGNSSENLENIVSSPNDVKIDNKLVVAATDNDKNLAVFSCFAINKVDVAVPGVNILSTYPNGKMGYMSGTSQAAPYAARVATLMLNENPELTAVEVKDIIMKTVDKKDWLSDKVISGGVININRAVQAARYSKSLANINDAISASMDEIADNITRSLHLRAPMTDFEKRLAIEFAF